MPQPSAVTVPAFQNILHYTARFILEKFPERQGDFSDLYVFLPATSSRVVQQFNTILCHSIKQDSPAIIPPWAGTLKSWAKQFCNNQHPDYTIVGEHSRQLLFIEALQQYPELFKEENQWQVTQALLSLFDELSLNQIDIFSSADEWQQRLEDAYGIEKQQSNFQHLHNESKIVYTLWHAWQQQLNESRSFDETGDYLSRLSHAISTLEQQQYFICLGLSQYSKSEQSFIKKLIDNNQCQVIEIGNTFNLTDSKSDSDAQNDHDFSILISETFVQPSASDTGQSIKQRARQYAEKHPDLALKTPPFSIYFASTEEQQIRAIDYYVRLNVLEGNNNIGIISEDRKLSRRLRALLERANIPLQDHAGWSLATTQAATIIERWLECIEEDFSAYPLLDCLKSPFINITQHVMSKDVSEDMTEDEFKKIVYRFEHDLVFHENISSNINRYKDQLKARLKRLNHWPATTYESLVNTLDYMQKVAAPLIALYPEPTLDTHYASSHSKNTSRKKIAIADFLKALSDSLQQLGVFQCYQNDDAGLVILKTFEQLKHSVSDSNPLLSWNDCRTWLGLALESQNFTPPTSQAKVQLMTLEQSSHLDFDCLIIAAAESQHFPGVSNNSAFFNQSVRASLGLQTWEQQRSQRHELFNRSLLAAPDILITACNEEKGEEKAVSPWLELLISFYNLAYTDKLGFKSLYNRELQQLVQSNNEVFNCDDSDLPQVSKQPAPTIPIDLFSKKVSASAYQRIINCPYQYFSGDSLRLKPVEELSDELKKAGYGERIHSILQTFHNGHKKFGKAYKKTITDTNRHAAEKFLSTLSEKIFLADLEDNVLHRSWLYRWQKHIPAYINWQIQHQKDWSIYLSEEHIEVTLTDARHSTVDRANGADSAITIYGRLDRIDKSKQDKTHAIIDYKTGLTAKQNDVDSGENVQLSTYALLDETASKVSYLSVDSSNQKVTTRSKLSGDNLQVNRENNKRRLLEISRQIKNHKPLPAWGDDTVCTYCNFSGLCRKEAWSKT